MIFIVNAGVVNLIEKTDANNTIIPDMENIN